MWGGSFSKETLFFVDPPYYRKGADLYTSFYDPEDHALLAKRMLELSQPWIVTYDDVPEIRMLYKQRRQFSLNIRYSIQEKRVGNELLITSKGLKIPDGLRAQQVNKPQYRAA